MFLTQLAMTDLTQRLRLHCIYNSCLVVLVHSVQIFLCMILAHHPAYFVVGR